MVTKGQIFNETTVWRDIVTPKTAKFNLNELPLKLEGVGGILRNLRENKKATQTDLANIIGSTRFTIYDIEKNRHGVLISDFSKMLKFLGNDELISNDFIKTHIQKKNIRLPDRHSDIEHIIRYLKPETDRTVMVNLKTPRNALGQIEEKFNVSIFHRKSKIVINSKNLSLFLRRFYEFKRELKLKFPLSKDVSFMENKVDLRKSVIIPLLQSDGYGTMSYFQFTAKSRALHDIFSDAMYYHFGKIPSGYYFDSCRDGCSKTYFIVNKRMSSELLKICGNFKTSPSKSQTGDEFLRERQPHLGYLKNATLEEKILAIRVYASAEGCITHTGKSPKFNIACASLTLIKDLKDVLSELGIKSSIEYRKGIWSGISGLNACSVASIERFREIGGFINGVEVADRSSPLFGVEKNKILDVVITHNKELNKRGKKIRDFIFA